MVGIKDSEQRKEWPYCSLWLISESFFGLFWRGICTVVLICLLTSASCWKWDTGGWVCVNRRIKSKRYCSCRWPPLCTRHQIETMRAWNRGVGEGRDEEEMGVKNGRSVSERSGLGAIWWRWSEVLKINNLLDMSSAKVWPDGPQPKGVRLRHVMNVFPDSLELRSMSGGVTDEPGKKTNLCEKGETSLRRRN